MKIKLILILISIFAYKNSTAQSKESFIRDGNKLYSDSSYNEAEMQYRKALEKNQDYFKASFNLANAIYKQNRIDESSSLFESILDNADSKNELAMIYHNLGNSLLAEQKIDEAIESYKNSLKINPDRQRQRRETKTETEKRQRKERERQRERDRETEQTLHLKVATQL